jgi:cytochrome c oxidase subunit II
MYVNIIWLCAALAALVFGVMLYSIATFARTGAVGSAAYRHSTAVELLWSLIPILILVSAAAPAVRTTASAESVSLASLQQRVD